MLFPTHLGTRRNYAFLSWTPQAFTFKNLTPQTSWDCLSSVIILAACPGCCPRLHPSRNFCLRETGQSSERPFQGMRYPLARTGVGIGRQHRSKSEHVSQAPAGSSSHICTLTKPPPGGCCYLLQFQRRKDRHREVKSADPSHKANKWLSWESNLALSTHAQPLLHTGPRDPGWMPRGATPPLLKKWLFAQISSLHLCAHVRRIAVQRGGRSAPASLSDLPPARPLRPAVRCVSGKPFAVWECILPLLSCRDPGGWSIAQDPLPRAEAGPRCPAARSAFFPFPHVAPRYRHTQTTFIPERTTALHGASGSPLFLLFANPPRKTFCLFCT